MKTELRYRFHGGCSGCENTIDVCPGCKYMDANWSLPNLNTEDITHTHKMCTDPEYAREYRRQQEKSRAEFKAYKAAQEAEHASWVGLAIKANQGDS